MFCGNAMYILEKYSFMFGGYKILVGKHEGRRPRGRPRRRWEDNIRMDLREVGWEGVDWIHLP
jgi:hypothetical protein